MNRYRYWAIVAMFCSVLSECATAGGPSPQSDPSRVTLVMSERWLGVQAIDSNRLSFVKQRSGDCDVTPGKHRITVRYGSTVTMELWLVAKAGKQYLLRKETTRTALGTSQKINFWFEDYDTGEKVGGLAGSDDEPAQ